MHESPNSPEEIKVGSEKSFGVVFAIFFTILGGVTSYAGGGGAYYFFGIAVVFLVLAFFAPAVLRPFNIIWFKFGLLLHKIVSPLIMGLLFYLTVTPIALIMRVLNKDTLRLRFEHGAESYWIEREPPGPEPESLTKQF